MNLRNMQYQAIKPTTIYFKFKWGDSYSLVSEDVNERSIESHNYIKLYKDSPVDLYDMGDTVTAKLLCYLNNNKSMVLGLIHNSLVVVRTQDFNTGKIL